MRIDEFFYNQPEPSFIEWLKSPVHTAPPESFGRKVKKDGEAYVGGAYINKCHPEWKDVIESATSDFETFLRVCEVYGDKYPINIEYKDGFSEESYSIVAESDSCTVYSSDCEGARRAIYYLEEEMIKREGPFLPLGECVRNCVITRRITRGFFSPTNRPPKFGDELLDEIDYYPENYLSRLAHNGTNGLWIYTSFAQLVNSPYMPSDEESCQKRMEKLRRVVERCKKYGVKVYIFAIEPIGLPEEKREPYRDMLGLNDESGEGMPLRPFCPRIEKTREHVIYCLEYIFKTIPELAGYISITAGERATTCVSVSEYMDCPRCGKYSRGENLAYSVDMIKEGLRRAGTGAEFISWTYGHRYWSDDDICEYIEKTPEDIVIMQNFEDGGLDDQLGRKRIAWDYWLSYPGPSDMFAMSARKATEGGKRAYAKMQVCSSHEMATVPYIPVPGILFDKYKTARELGVTGIMECWYFGNYPSLMNRASTELSYLEDFSDKSAFVRELAARLYGETKADAISAAWEEFERGYRNYPTNIMFSYYGPMHDGVVWELSPIPKNNPLPRSWLLPDVPDGDRIGECLFQGHSLDEAITLADRMSESWGRGVALLPLSDGDEHRACSEAIGLLMKSGRNILSFYRLREALGTESADALTTLAEMETIIYREIENSEKMIRLCELDPRIGYHSEAEGFKFFPEKLSTRIKKLKHLFDTEFKDIRERIASGKKPLGYYYAEGEEYYPIGLDKDNMEMVKIDEHRSFGAYIDGDDIKIAISCKKGDPFCVCFELQLFFPESLVKYSPENGLSLGHYVLSHQSVFGEEMIKSQLSVWNLQTKIDGDRAEHMLSLTVPKEKWNRKTAIKLFIEVEDKMWIPESENVVITLGKGDISQTRFGFMLPRQK